MSGAVNKLDVAGMSAPYMKRTMLSGSNPHVLSLCPTFSRMNNCFLLRLSNAKAPDDICLFHAKTLLLGDSNLKELKTSTTNSVGFSQPHATLSELYDLVKGDKDCTKCKTKCKKTFTRSVIIAGGLGNLVNLACRFDKFPSKEGIRLIAKDVQDGVTRFKRFFEKADVQFYMSIFNSKTFVKSTQVKRARKKAFGGLSNANLVKLLEEAIKVIIPLRFGTASLLKPNRSDPQELTTREDYRAYYDGIIKVIEKKIEPDNFHLLKIYPDEIPTPSQRQRCINRDTDDAIATTAQLLEVGKTNADNKEMIKKIIDAQILSINKISMTKRQQLHCYQT